MALQGSRIRARDIGILIALLSLTQQSGAAAQTVTPNTRPGAKTSSPTDESGLTEPQRVSATTFAQAFEAALSEGDKEVFRDAWDRDAIADAICRDVEIEGEILSGFRAGLIRGLSSSLDAILTGCAEDNVRFKRLLVLDGKPMMRFRMDGEGGISLVDFVLSAREGGWRIVNLHNRTLGFDLIEQSIQSSLPVLASLDPGFLTRWLGLGAVKTSEIEVLRRLGQANLKGDFATVLATYRELPEVLRETSVATLMHLKALGEVGDEGEYARELERAAERFPAPLFRFTLLDAYFLSGQWDKAIQVLDDFMQAVEKDAALLALRATLHLEAGRIDEAVQSLRDGLALEADCVFAHTAGLDVLLAAKDWAGVRDSLIFLESTGEYDFRGVLEEETWSEFLRAPESESWR